MSGVNGMPCPELQVYQNVNKGAKTLIFDRDGTINVDKGYTFEISEFEFTQQFLRIVPTLRLFEGNICIVTNQGGVRLGKYRKNQSNEFTQHLILRAKQIGVHINLVVTCYHHDLDGCNFRKPASGMIQEVEKRTESRLESYLYIGNDKRDLEAAKDRNMSYLDIDLNELELSITKWINSS